MKRALSISVSVIAVLGVSAMLLTASSANSKTEVTFSKDVAPIFNKACIECHRPKDIAPFSLLTVKEARPWAKSIKAKVISREMPPWGADPHFGQFANNTELSQKEIDTIVAWVDGGAKEGNPKDLPQVPEFAKPDGWQIGKPDVVLSMQEEWTTKPGDPDNYIYFMLPTNFTEDKWIQAAEIKPGNRTIVHHVIAFIMTPEQAAKRKEAEASGARRATNPNSVSYWDGTLRRTKMDAAVMDNTCDQPAGAGRQRNSNGEEGNGALLAGYAPGKPVDLYPAGTAKRVPKGAVILFQMHYSSFRGDLAKPEKDRTSVAMIFAKEPPDKMLMTFGLANTMFKIPAGAENHEVVACQTLPRDMQIAGYMPHMHVRGKDMKYEVIYPDGRRETLLNVPKFNFNWQMFYALKNPLNIPKGSKLIVTAHFDNSKKNKYNPDPTVPVRWGDPTYDEMMIGWMDIIIDNPLKVVKQDAAARASGK
jgi:hypothetical protein